MKKQRVKIKYPHIRIAIGDEVLESKDWEGEVENLTDLRFRLGESFHDVLRIFLRRLQKSTFEATLTMEQFGDRELSVPFAVDGIPWTVTPAISEQSLKAAAGEGIAIRFMGLLHKTLYGVSVRDDKIRSRVKTIATLRSLGLIHSPWRTTEKGTEVLKQLHELGPSSGREGFVMIAKELLSIAERQHARNPLRKYLYDRKLITAENKGLGGSSHTGDFKLTKRGTEWLEENSIRMLQLKQFEACISLISFLPTKALNEFLASGVEEVRSAARGRMNQLGK